MIEWNPLIKMILSDVDETVADLYLPATEEMVSELEKTLRSGVVIFFITGQGLEGVKRRITDSISDKIRQKILIAPCSGVEVWGFDINGNLLPYPYYSLYEQKINNDQQKKWREIVQQLAREFELKILPVMPIQQFKNKYGDDPLTVMLEDRGPQITFEMVNSYDLDPAQIKNLKNQVPLTHGSYDLRIPILERAKILLEKNNIPVTPRLGGVFALDLAVEGVSKTTSVKHVLENDNILKSLKLSAEELKNPDFLEIWGDKFSIIRGGSDRHMCEAVNPKVRTIDFRQENPSEFLTEYNIQVWNGEKRLHEGLLEYLQSRQLSLND